MKIFKLWAGALVVLLLTVPVSGQNYLSHSEQLREFQQLSSRHNFVNLVNYGASEGGRTLFALEVGRGDLSQKPGLLVIAGVEPDDLAGPAAAHAFATYLITAAQSDSVSALLDRYAIYIIPRASPDPLEGYFESPRVVRQGNDKPQDNDRDGAYDEDGPEDLNRDGLITHMRVAKVGGEWIPVPGEPFLMRKANISNGETGTHHLFSEGRDNDGDGRINEDAPGGENLNRNMTHDYKPYTSEGGIHPFSASEARALGDYVFDRRNIAAVFTFGPFDNLKNAWSIKWPERRDAANVFHTDSVSTRIAVKRLSEKAAYSQSGSAPGDVARWAYWDAGRFSFTAPAWAYPEVPDSIRRDVSLDAASGREFKALHWLRENDSESVIEWASIQHPDFPDNRVEVGGIAPFRLSTPPESVIPQIQENAIPVLYELATLLPHLDIDAPKVESLGGEVYRVTFTLHNKGVLHSFTQTGVRVLAMPYITSRLTLGRNQRILDGHPVTLVRDPIPGGGAHQLTYTIMGRGEFTARIGAPTIGFRDITINLR